MAEPQDPPCVLDGPTRNDTVRCGCTSPHAVPCWVTRKARGLDRGTGWVGMGEGSGGTWYARRLRKTGELKFKCEEF